MIIDLTMTLREGIMTFPVHWHPVVEITQLGRFHVEGRESRKVVMGTHMADHELVSVADHQSPRRPSLDRK